MASFDVSSEEPSSCDEQRWQEDGEAIIADVQPHVHRIELSKNLVSDEHCVYFNLETKENNRYTIVMTVRGFKICANEFETIDEQYEDENYEMYYETIYALLDTVSPKYRECFGSALIDKLSKLQQSQH
ncbi:GSK3-beta interaction protein-like protein [Dinothrombium tinctorium]|uniref:GSK3-beta interaction protein-like protein n=1 Tax=Dinothrombium tinctorium TaxID=1965070 RepID=A0A443RCA1_9ACAR|nr:GSK3-beta interaction protein-like protein [Dinothrombium tinctorium]RWS12965.1 GSK3-beta interaction protein-like protein [Dinothrombium tinctorium]